jgi:hypothetical protein
MKPYTSYCSATVCVLSAIAFLLIAANTQAQLVPGTGKKIDAVGDDFEDPEWGFNGNWPKSTEENDGRHRYPSGARRS